ncbi:MAG: helix-turn-helix domain-containing protein [Chloroflexota bacterium]
MPPSIRTTLADLVRSTRTRLDISQQQLADACHIDRSYVALIELGRANPTLAVVQRLGQALGLELEMVGRPPLILGGPRQRDLVHARCSGHVDRRFNGAAWETAREVEIVHGRTHGWIDLLAYDPRTATLVIVEIKTWLDDIGALERQLAWYERSASQVAGRLGWRPRSLMTWVLALASREVDEAIRLHRDVLALALPARAEAMTAVLAGSPPSHSRGLALIDPSSGRRDWLLRTTVDGRRRAAPYADYADAARRFAA